MPKSAAGRRLSSAPQASQHLDNGTDPAFPAGAQLQAKTQTGLCCRRQQKGETHMDHETKAMFELIIQKMDSRFDSIDKRLDAVEKRLDSVEKRLDKLESDVGFLKARQDRDSRNLKDLQLQVKILERDMHRGFARLNDSVDTIAEVLRLNGLIPG